MTRMLRWILIMMGDLIGLIVVAGLLGYFISEGRINQTYPITVEPLTVPSDAASIEEGRRLATIRGCADCHGADLGGKTMIDDPMLGHFYAANLTPGQGSATADFTAEDWDRAVRHAIAPDGRGLIIMPSVELAGLSDEDLGRIVAYLQSVPPVDHELPESAFGPLGRVMLLTNQIPFFSAELIDHSVRAPKSVTPEATVEFGAYMATTCTGCHGPDLAGGPVPASAPGDPLAANLTPGGELATWTYEDFTNTLRTGVTPTGKVLNPANMPWPITSEMTDTEQQALWAYINSVPPAANVQ